MMEFTSCCTIKFFISLRTEYLTSLSAAPHTQWLPMFVAGSHGNLLVPACQQELNLGNSLSPGCCLTSWVWLHLVQIWKKKVTPTHSVWPIAVNIRVTNVFGMLCFWQYLDPVSPFQPMRLFIAFLKAYFKTQCPRREKTNCLHKQTNREELNTHASWVPLVGVSMNSLIQWVRKNFLVLIKRVLMWLRMLLRKDNWVLMISPIQLGDQK